MHKVDGQRADRIVQLSAVNEHDGENTTTRDRADEDGAGDTDEAQQGVIATEPGQQPFGTCPDRVFR